MLVDMSEERGIIDRGEEELIQEVVDFGNTRIKEVMVPRVEVGAFGLTKSREELLKLIQQTHHARVPVYTRDIDHIEGIIYTKEFLMSPERPLRSFIRKVPFVPETKTVESMLAEFRRTDTRMAIVVDEYGGTAGLVTLEDLVEEIVGEIEDEHDQVEEPVRRLGPRRFMLSGKLSIRDWAELFEVELADTAVTTVGGLVVSLLGHLPRTGEQVSFGNLTLTVTKMSRRRVQEVVLAVLDNNNVGGEEGASPGETPGGIAGRGSHDGN